MKRLDVKMTQQKNRTYRQTLITVAASLLLVTVILVNLFTHVLPVLRYYGDGMEPTLSNGDLLLLVKTTKVEEGDVIAFYYNNKVLVRRVICEGGKQISIEEDGAVSLNGNRIEEPYLESTSIGQCNLTFPHYVSPGSVFVMGDRRETAMDSRLKEIGSISTDRILGKVLLVL